MRRSVTTALAAAAALVALAPAARADTTVAMSVRAGVHYVHEQTDEWFAGTTTPQIDIAIDGLPDGGTTICKFEGDGVNADDAVPCGTQTTDGCSHQECLVFQWPQPLKDHGGYFLYLDTEDADGNFTAPEQNLGFEIQTSAPSAEILGPRGSPQRPIFDFDTNSSTDIPNTFECTLHMRGTAARYARCPTTWRSARLPLDHRIYELDVRAKDALGHLGPVAVLTWSPYPCTLRAAGRLPTPRAYAAHGLRVAVSCALSTSDPPLILGLEASVSPRQAAALGEGNFGRFVGQGKGAVRQQIETQILRIHCEVLCSDIRHAHRVTLQIGADPAIGEYDIPYYTRVVLRG
ncbi:MAG: hypothetical protein JWM71_2407 [Solirubrobacteraceae bacterium]|nr:hypothetical protein [Solirubrobacteraceae bacterium]